jgi:phosphoribosylformimino-5-aminoimidazole carboxamide ribotide isomerase
MRLIIAIDIIGGKCVRLTRGDFNTKKVYNEDPVDVAKQVEDNGLKYLHLVDLDGAKNRKVENLKVLEKIASKTSLTIDFGGGIRTLDDVKTIINAGASQVTAGSIAVTNTKMLLEWVSEIGPPKIILGADCINRKVSTSGWIETSDKDIISYISYYRSHGMMYTVCTDIDKDGMLKGPSTELYKEIMEKTDINLIASGGITTIDDIESLTSIGCEGAIIGKAVYEGKLTLKSLGRIC